MKSSRLFEILSTLDNKEFSRLGEYLNSPFLNKNRQVISFYYFLLGKKIHPGYSNIDREEIFIYIYAGQKFDLNKYLKLTSDFVKAIEKFLVYEFREKKTVYNKRILLEIARERKLSKTFDKYFKELDLYGKNDLNKDLDYYLMEYETKVEALLYNLNKRKFDLENALLDVNNTVDVMITSNKLDLFIKLPDTGDKQQTIWLRKEVAQFVDDNNEYFRKNHLLIYLKRLILKMFDDLDENAYAEFKKLLNLNRQNISPENQIYLYDKLLAFCSMMNSDNYKSEEFQIIKMMEENSLLFYEMKFIDYNYFLNIVNCGLSENQIFWTENFIKKYQVRISDEFRTNSSNLAIASVNLYRQKFGEALDNVLSVNSDNDFFYLSSKILLIIIYVELNEEKSVQYAIDAVRNFLANRKSTNEFDSNSYNSFLKYVRKLLSINAKPAAGSREISAMIDDIENDESVVNKDWLLRKIRAIEHSKRKLKQS